MKSWISPLVTLGIAALIASPASAQPGFGRGMGGGPQGPNLGLLSVESVQKALKLTEEQVGKATQAAEASRARMMELMSELQDLSPEERREKMQGVQKTLRDESTKALKELLSDEQIKRFEQIGIQAQGYRAFLNPDHQAKLKLTEDQKGSLQSISEEMGSQMREAFQAAAGDREAMMEKMASMQKEALSKVNALLTDDQKALWKEMTGEPVELPPGAGMGFGGGRRRPQG